MHFLRKITPIWLSIGTINAVTIPLILPKNKIAKTEEPKSMLNVILAKPATTKAPKPDNNAEKLRQQKNFEICQRNMNWKYCRSKYYWHD